MAPILNTLLPTAYSSQTGTAWTTTTVGNVDEGIAGADGLFIVAGVNSTSSIFYDITDTPSDFVKMINFNYDIRYKITPLSNDTEALYVQVFKSDKTTALTDEMLVVSTTTALTIGNKGSTAFTGVSTTATKADWDGAYFRIRTTHSAAGAKDNSIWSIDGFEMTGTYNTPPTVVLNTPTNGQTVSDNTPALNFTGTDANSDEIDYEVQVNNSSIFSSVSDPDSYWDNDSFAFNSSLSDYASVAGSISLDGSTSARYLHATKTNAPSSGSTITQVRVRMYGATSQVAATWGSYATLTAPTGGWTWSKLQNLEIKAWHEYVTFNHTGLYFNVYTESLGESLGNGNVGFSVNADSWAYIYSVEIEVTAGSVYNYYFKSILLDAYSSVDDHANWSGTGDPHPWPSGNAVTYTVPAGSALSAGTHYWRVRGIDPSGGNTYGSWSDTFSFTISTQTTFTQNKYRWYYDNDLINPVTAWGTSALAENTSIGIIPSGKDPPDTIQELRLRVNLVVNGLTLPASSKYFKLEYKAGTDGSCTTGTWTDVGTGTWTYATSGVTDGSNITASLSDTTSGKGEQYAKSKPTVLNSAGASVGEIIEYDFHIIGGTATPNTTYSFRMVGTDTGGTGETVLDAYTNCPTLTTEPGTADLMRHGQVFTNSIKQGFFWTN